MMRTSPEQRELCRLLSPLHERFCAKHRRAQGEPCDGDPQSSNDSTTYRFSLVEFRAALDELWSAAKELDRSMQQRSSADMRAIVFTFQKESASAEGHQ